MGRTIERLTLILFFGAVTGLPAGCGTRGSSSGKAPGLSPVRTAASAGLFIPCAQDRPGVTETQEARLARLIDQALEAQWYLKKARDARDPRRVETLAREIEERLRTLEASLGRDGGTGGFTDPACRAKLKEEILPRLEEMKQAWGRFLSRHIGCTPGDLAARRDAMRAALERGDRGRCLAIYHELELAIGTRTLRYVPLLEESVRPVLEEIVRLGQAARGKAPLPAAHDGPPTAPRAVAYLVRVIPTRGEPYPAVIRNPPELRDLLARKGRILPSDLPAGAEVMLHYMRGLNGTMGLPAARMKEIRADRPLDEEGLATVKERIARRIHRGDERRPRRPEASPAPVRPPARGPEAAPSVTPNPEEGRWPLLRRFPPEKGWSPERKAEIERRTVVLGVFPGPEEKAFLEQFDAWSRELAERRKAEGTESGVKRTDR